MPNGKGDTPRPLDTQKFNENYDQIDWDSEPTKSKSKSEKYFYGEIRLSGLKGKTNKKKLSRALVAALEQIWIELGDADVEVVLEESNSKGDFIESKLPKELKQLVTRPT